jgi:hypothetical protein
VLRVQYLRWSCLTGYFATTVTRKLSVSLLRFRAPLQSAQTLESSMSLGNEKALCTQVNILHSKSVGIKDALLVVVTWS